MKDEMITLKNESILTLKNLIATESFSGQEEKTADIIYNYLESKKASPQRIQNNIWCWAKPKDPKKKTVLLNSHHDTVKPGSSWIVDPFTPFQEGNKITGLGSNDAGASVVALIATFLYLSKLDLPYNLVLAITAEEENSGSNNVQAILPVLGEIDLAIVGEPTQMQMAIAERGLVVLDCYAHGKTGHAARDEGENAIYKAIEDIKWINQFQFEKKSDFLGPVKMTVTQINSGKQHNVVPDLCHFVVDVRVNENYTNEEVSNIIQQNIKSQVVPRSYRLNSSYIDPEHPIVKKGKKLGLRTYGSPTLSDQAVMNFNTIKIGPGDSTRSHTPDEFIYIDEIEKGIDTYVELLKDFNF